MYWVKYISYFFYLGFNWNFPLAWFIVQREVRGERKYGLKTTGIDDLSTSVSKQDRVHASIYQPLNFYTAEKLFEQITDDDKRGVFLDIGCGKGRILAMAAANGFKEIIGIDFSAKLCHEAVQNAVIIETKYPSSTVVIDCIDAREYEIPSDVSVIFMFNPFDDLVMMDVTHQIVHSLRKHPRPLKILYANPQCKKQLLSAGFTELHHFQKMYYLQGSVLINS